MSFQTLASDVGMQCDVIVYLITGRGHDTRLLEQSDFALTSLQSYVNRIAFKIRSEIMSNRTCSPFH